MGDEKELPEVQVNLDEDAANRLYTIMQAHPELPAEMIMGSALRLWFSVLAGDAHVFFRSGEVVGVPPAGAEEMELLTRH